MFNAKLIGDKPIPERFERVTPNFLRKMATQAQEGVSLLIDHPWRTFGSRVPAFPFGRTFDAKLQTELDGELALYADHYIVRGQSFMGIDTDDLIGAIDAGTLFDTSIGFGVTKAICNIDGLDYYGGKCLHFRGCEYDGQVCSVDDDDGYLMENSLVFDGAYPGAGVVAASKTASNDGSEQTNTLVLTEDESVLKNADRILFSFSQKRGLQSYAQLSDAPAKTEGADQVNELEKAQEALSQANVALSGANGILSKVREALGVTEDGAIHATVTALQAKAELGAQYVAKVVEEACGAGVRAMGEAFNVESMKLAFSHLPVAEVEKIRDTYEAQAKSALGGGGQHIVTDPKTLPDNPTANANGNPELTIEQKLEQARKSAREAMERTGNKNLLKEAN